MRFSDRHAIQRLKIPGVLLMENAGRGTVDRIQKHFGGVANRSFTILSGKGNNGGDGFVIARHLYLRGARVSVALLGNPQDLTNDAKVNYLSLSSIAKQSKRSGMLRLCSVRSTRSLSVLPKTEFVIDAIFGTGFSGAVQGFYAGAIKWINAHPGKKISVDIPSGVDADTGGVANLAVMADFTVTMAMMKIGLVVGKGKSCAGIVEVTDIGSPGITQDVKKHFCFLVEGSDVARSLPLRPLDAHKHSVGKIFVLAGSRGLTGAAAMTSASALKSGAGTVILGTPASVYPILARKLTEVMVEPLPETHEGSLGLSGFSSIQKHISWADVVILGPGLSRNPETKELVWKIVSGCDTKLLIDADGLNNLAEKMSVLKQRRNREIVITPHTGEFARLSGLSSGEVEGRRVEVARAFARRYACTVVLKGAPTATAGEDGTVFINSTGNPGMATAGSGDVLSGMIGGLWAQGMARTDAAFSGVYLHGLAGDVARDRFGEKSLTATDIQHAIPDAIRSTERQERE
jgi:hydroxyethylthiazole kinase-like uncharacterized protein yjeF